LANTIKENNLQYADIAISEGNIANIVAMYPIHTSTNTTSPNSKPAYQFEIFFIRGLLDATHIPPLQPGHEVVIKEGKGLTQSPTEPLFANLTNPTLPKPETQPQVNRPEFEITSSFSIFLGAVPAFILLGLFLIVRNWAKHR
jgi:hypothetical protein